MTDERIKSFFELVPPNAHVELCCDEGSLIMYLYIKDTEAKITMAHFDTVGSKALFFQMYNEMARLIELGNCGICGKKMEELHGGK